MKMMGQIELEAALPASSLGSSVSNREFVFGFLGIQFTWRW
jgi:hypothetical protein